MNNYEAKQERRRQRYAELADKAEQESKQRYNSFRKIADGIPMGQPILVGHHSERHHRADIKRMDNNMRKSVEASKRAEYYRGKAAGVGSAGISSDDPEAADKLQEKLAKAEKVQELYKAINKMIRKPPFGKPTPEKIAELVKLGLTELNAAEVFKPDFCGRIGIPDYRLKNNNANIRRMRQRVAQLSAVADHQEVEQEHEGVTYREADNRVQLLFPGKPPVEVRALLKSWGFRWSPTNMAWQRHLNSSGQFAAQQVLAKLKEMPHG